jgi:methylaspartate mutase epsilon subunit
MNSIKNKRWTEDELFEKRKEVLAQWPTGREVDLNEAIEYHKHLPSHKKVPELGRNTRQGRIQIGKLFGHALVEDNVEHIKLLEDAGIDYISLFLDAYSRHGQFEKAQSALEESRKRGSTMLNGFPVVNQGVYNTRKLIESVNIPIRSGCAHTEDPRLAQEMTLAGGCTWIEFHNLNDLIQHSKNYPLDKRIMNDQYGTRLAAYYTEHGAPIQMFTPAPLGGLEPPEMRIAVLILASLLAAEQGLKQINPTLNSTVHLIQTAASLKVLRKLMREYLDSSGYTDTEINIGGDLWQGAWPYDLHEASAFLAYNLVTVVFGNVDNITIKGIDEAQGISTKAADIAATKMTRKIIDTMSNGRLPDNDELNLEEEMITQAVKAIVNKVVDLGDGDIAIGQIKAVEYGVIDAAFSPWRYLAKKTLPVRDATGAIRYLQSGNIPLPKEVVKYHKQRVDERKQSTRSKTDIEMVIEDVTRFSRPLFKEVIQDN